MVGSSDSIASANIVLNTIVAEAFCEAADVLEKAEDFSEAVHDLIKRLMIEHRRIIFNGNGYTEEWVQEAARRGLPNFPAMVDAIPQMLTPKSVRLYERFGVYTKAELESRSEIDYDIYSKQMNVEARAMINISSKSILPAVIRYTTVLADSVKTVTEACPEADASVQRELLVECCSLLKQAREAVKNLTEETDRAVAITSAAERAHTYHDRVAPAMAALRAPIDALELKVEKKFWPMPSYGDMIFEV